ncbi:ABC transporter [Bacillus licheniformis]|nr:ABC transporter [Bacillus licheniformis]
MKTENNNSMKPFFSMILTSGVPRLALSAGLTASLVTTLVGLSIPLLTREMVDGFSANSINLALSGILALVFIVQAVCDGFSTYFLSYAGQKVVASLRERMWFKLLRLPVRYFDEKTSGETVSRVVNDTGIVESLISDHFPQFVSGIITIVGSVVILLIMDWKMTLLMLISVPITTFIMIPLGMKMQRISKTMQDETASFTGHVQQTLSEIRLMKASNAEHTEK